jgi:peptidoglycan/LPS O-acetylase OafA/YrhL
VTKSSSLEGLRFFLAIWVFFAHLVPWHDYSTGTPPTNRTGFLDFFQTLAQVTQPKSSLHPAVIGFLVLSGYVIGVGFDQKAHIRLKYKFVASWLIRRGFRILPVYLLSVLLGALIYVSLEGADERILTGTQILSYPCLLAKSFSISSFYPGAYPNCAFQGNAPLVTTAAEIGLYFVFVISMVGVLSGFFKLIATLLPLFWLAGNLIVAFNSTNPSLLEWWTHASAINYIFPWFAGMILAFFEKRENISYLKMLQRNFGIVVFILFLTYFLRSNHSIDFYVRQLMLVFWTLVFYFILKVFPKKVTRFQSQLNFLGGISYAIYAVHAPLAIYLLFKGFNFISIICIVFLICFLIYFFYEKPIRRLGRRISGTMIDKN